MPIKEILALSISILGEIIGYIILIRCILSFLPIRGNAFVNAIYNLSEPILSPARKLINTLFRRQMMVDFSPIVVFILMDYFIIPFIIRFIYFIFK